MRVHKCASCGARFDVSKFPAGKKIRCARCKAIFEVPVAEAAAAGASAPADDSMEDARTQIRRKESEVAATAKPTARGGAKAEPAGKAGRAAAATAEPPSRSRAARDARPAAPAGKKSPALLIGGIVGGVLVLAGLGYAMLGGEPRPPKKKLLVDATRIEEALEATKLTDADSVLALADWCKAKGLADKRDEYLDAAWKLEPRGGLVLQKLNERGGERMAALSETDLDAAWKFVQWSDERGLRSLGDVKADAILKKEPDHEAAHKRRGDVAMDGEWLDARTAAVRQKEKDEKAAKEAEIARQGPRGQAVLTRLEEAKEKFGGAEFDFMDMTKIGSPYLILLEKDKRVIAEVRLEELGEVMTQLYKLWFAMYGEKFQLKEFDDAVMPIWVYATEDGYKKYAKNPKAAAHFEPWNGWFIVNNELDDIYGVMFHEGIHQLVDYSTRVRGGHRTNKFWFTEGVATYFEIFERRGDNFILGRTRPAKNPYLSTSKDLIRREHAMKLVEFIDMDYSEAQISNTTYSHYSQSWALTHFLNKYEEGKYVEKFEQYFVEEVAGKGGPETFQRIFGDLDALEKEWQEFILTLR